MFYWFAWIILRIFLHLRCDYKIIGLENIPKTGGAIILSNHRSYADPFVVGCAIHYRRTYFFAKEELFNIPIFGPMISALGAFPAKRNILDRKNLNHFLELLKDGKLLLIFGEGTRNLGKELLPLKGGFAFLSIRAKVPVIPVYITETEEILKLRYFRPKVNVRFGKPIFCDNIKEFTVKATQALENLS